MEVETLWLTSWAGAALQVHLPTTAMLPSARLVPWGAVAAQRGTELVVLSSPNLEEHQ